MSPKGWSSPLIAAWTRGGDSPTSALVLLPVAVGEPELHAA